MQLIMQFFALLHSKLWKTLSSVTLPEMDMSRNIFVAVIIAKIEHVLQWCYGCIPISKDVCYTGQFFCVTCVTTKLGDSVLEYLPSAE